MHAHGGNGDVLDSPAAPLGSLALNTSARRRQAGNRRRRWGGWWWMCGVRGSQMKKSAQKRGLSLAQKRRFGVGTSAVLPKWLLYNPCILCEGHFKSVRHGGYASGAMGALPRTIMGQILFSSPSAANYSRTCMVMVDDSNTIRRAARRSFSSKAGMKSCWLRMASMRLPKVNDYPPTDFLRHPDAAPRWIPDLCHHQAQPKFAKVPVVVMLSSKDGVFDKARGRMVGAEDYFTKPLPKTSCSRPCSSLGPVLQGAIDGHSKVLIVDDSRRKSCPDRVAAERPGSVRSAENADEAFKRLTEERRT